MLSQVRKPVKDIKEVTATQFKFVGGRLCLDFVNTVGARGSSQTREKLVSFANLMRWSEQAGILSRPKAARLLRRAAAQPRVARSVLARAISLREALHRILKSAVEGRNPVQADLRHLNREIAIARTRQRLTHSAGAFLWTWEDDGALDRTLWPVAISAAELLTSDSLGLVRRCGDEECGWMFLDTSRNRSRHWCDMRDCGNRAKVARFRQRLRG